MQDNKITYLLQNTVSKKIKDKKQCGPANNVIFMERNKNQ